MATVSLPSLHCVNIARMRSSSSHHSETTRPAHRHSPSSYSHPNPNVWPGPATVHDGEAREVKLSASRDWLSPHYAHSPHTVAPSKHQHPHPYIRVEPYVEVKPRPSCLRSSGSRPSHHDLQTHPSSPPADRPVPHPSYFNSTVPALNSSLLYDAEPPTATVLDRTSGSTSRHSDPIGGSESRPLPLPTGASSSRLGPIRHSRPRQATSLKRPSAPRQVVLPSIEADRPSSPWCGPSSLRVFPPTPTTRPPSLTSLAAIPSLASALFSPHPTSAETTTVGFGGATNMSGIDNMSLGVAAGVPRSMGSLGVDDSLQETIESTEALISLERHRRRRETHNAVERRRRDNINGRISELATLIPEHMLVDNADDSATPGTKAEETADNDGILKAKKGAVLGKSVDYIRYLQQVVTAQGARHRELEEELSGFSSAPSSVSGSDTEEMVLGDFLNGFDGSLGLWGQLTSDSQEERKC
ncbi:unnamed protein product [Mycena citricolor]|uniref:BHLH domain-containing protein n=1 Tax=Mycena citricolor TaxID=2018698 RepID=A0AAD2JXQ6_9AGAR|nr:unnamed protein product [Mycena citricolor]CAK5273416.1 unnamed protein product [Mycena citricolor]